MKDQHIRFVMQKMKKSKKDEDVALEEIEKVMSSEECKRYRLKKMHKETREKR